MSDRGTGPVKVLVVDDHPVVQEGVAILVGSDPGIDIVGRAGSATAAIEAARDLRPDVILLDLRLPDRLASEAIPLLRMASGGSRIIIFTAYAGHRGLQAAIEAGADCCLRKDTADLATAIKRAARGERFVDPRLTEDFSPGRIPTQTGGPPLTRREYEVLRHMAMGKTNPEIAEAIGLRRSTVKSYLQTALQKLGARNRVEAIAKANEAGLL